jgi:heme exporter protein A
MAETDNRDSGEFAVRVENLSKSFGVLEAVRGISFGLRKGEFLAVFGPNGAGKTTLIKMLATLTRPTSGAAWVAGHNVAEASPELRREIGVISHMTCLYGDLTAFENMLFYARMYAINDPQSRASQVIDEVGLKSRMHDRVHTFSRGMLQRLSIARAIIHNPSVLFLDEPYTGLDLHSARVFKDQLAGLHTEKRTVIMITHDIGRGLEMADAVAVQVRGKFVYMQPIDNVDQDRFEDQYFDIVQNNR